MNRETFDTLVAQAVQEAVDRLLPNGSGVVTKQRLRAALGTLAQRVAGYSRDYELLNLATADDLAERWSVSVRRARALIVDRNKRFGMGMKVGNQWLLSAAEIEQIEPDIKHRRKIANDDR